MDGIWIIESLYFEVRIFQIHSIYSIYFNSIFIFCPSFLGFQAYLVWNNSDNDHVEIKIKLLPSDLGLVSDTGTRDP